jgi:hypothetical protein
VQSLTRRGIFGSNAGATQDALAPVPETALLLDRHRVAVYLAGLSAKNHSGSGQANPRQFEQFRLLYRRAPDAMPLACEIADAPRRRYEPMSLP